MNAQSQNLLKQLADIKGLDHITAWPLAIGWWIIIALAIAGLTSFIVHRLRRRAYKRSWKGDALRELEGMADNLKTDNSHQIVAAFSALMRRIAIRRTSRAECAGLEGKAWLSWLKAHDPKGFDWIHKGTMLTEIPYAPPGTTVEGDRLKTLIDAARAWVK